MLFKVSISLIAIFLVLFYLERTTRANKIDPGYSRKIIHIFVACFVACWPFYLSYSYIELAALAFVVVVSLSRQFSVLKSIHNVNHKTVGDLIFPLSIGILALLGPAKSIFLLAFLIMGLSDGLAGLAGIRYGKKMTKYQNQPIISSLVFFVVTLLILVVYKLIDPNGVANLTWLVVFVLPVVAALVENLSMSGSDDLTVPLVVFVTLRWL